MIEDISWSVAIPVALVLTMLALVLMLVQRITDATASLEARILAVKKDLDMSTNENDVAYYQGYYDALVLAKALIQLAAEKPHD